MKRVFLSTLALIFCLSILIIGFSILPLELSSEVLESMALGSITNLTDDRVIYSIRILGTTWLLLACVLYAARRNLLVYLTLLGNSASFVSRNLIGQLLVWVRQEDRLHIATLALTFVLGIAFRLHFLFQPIRTDEAWTYMSYASKPIVVGLSVYSTTNNHLFHTFLVHISTLLFGSEPWAIRLPVLVAGSLLVLAGYILIRMLFSKEAGLLAAVMIACSPILIDYSTNARGYAIVCLIFVLLISLGDYIRRNDELAAKGMFALLASLGLYTVPIMVYPLGSVFLWLALSALANNVSIDKWNFIKSLFWMAMATLLLTLTFYMPAIILTGVDSIFSNKAVSSQNWDVFLASVPLRLSWLWEDWHEGVPLLGEILLILGFLWALLRHKATANHRVPIVIAVIICCASLVLAQRVLAPERVWLFLLPIYLGIASVGLVDGIKLLGKSMFSTQVVSLLSLVTLITLGLGILTNKPDYFYVHKGLLLDVEKVVNYFHDELKDNDKIVSVFPSTKPLKYYFQKHDISTKYFNLESFATQGASENRIFVVIKKPKQDLEYVIDKRNRLKNFSMNLKDYVQLSVKKFDSAHVVSLRRITK